MTDKPISLTSAPQGYADWLADLKGRIHAAQQRAALAVNRELVLLYWQIGRDILQRQALQGWSAKVIERLAHDLRTAFPDMKGFSRANLMYMRAFAEARPDAGIVQQAVGQLPWGHNLVLLSKLKEPEDRLAYARAVIEHGWSRNVLNIHIETRLLERSGKAVTNFEARLPKAQSDLAIESLKDPYRFDFLGLDVGGEEFFIDLLFYHLKLRCYVVIELKAGKFKPEHLGQLGFYLTAVDRQMKHEHDNPTIGLLQSLPEELQTSLPTIEQIERELGGHAGE
jgi:predicted nuclease of restriction endonuclease-like (RecB) superfamily